jgi:HPt (histidine-containing phosphotransfer) domain-containing protein
MAFSPTPRATSGQSRASIQEIWSPPPSLLEAVCGDDDLIADLIETFNTDTSARMREIHTALAHCDFSRIRTEAHAIKGGARQLGVHAVADVCQELENLGISPDASLVAVQLNLAQDSVDQARRAMTAYLTGR